MKIDSRQRPAKIASGWVFLCRGGYEQTLCREISLRLGLDAQGESSCQVPCAGLVVFAGGFAPKAMKKLAEPLVFERQRLPEARWVALASIESLAAALAGECAGKLRLAGAAWTLQAFTASPDAPGPLKSWARRMGEGLRTALVDLAPPLGGHYREHAADLPPARGRVLQICAVPGGIWVALCAPNELSNVCPGAVPLLAADPQAPSRAFLKIEEAFQVLGITPAPRQKVIDLGAAPGGWSYAFLKRGCKVLAVDNGPLKLRDVETLAGELTHVRANGLTFHPPRGWTPVDWMVSDMLVPPGPNTGLLRRWLRAGWAERYVVNIKLPQREPLVALQPLQEMLAGQPGLTWRMRQLFHDRREVTLMAQANAASLSSAARSPRTASKRAASSSAPPSRGPSGKIPRSARGIRRKKSRP